MDGLFLWVIFNALLRKLVPTVLLTNHKEDDSQKVLLPLITIGKQRNTTYKMHNVSYVNSLNLFILSVSTEE